MPSFFTLKGIRKVYYGGDMEKTFVNPRVLTREAIRLSKKYGNSHYLPAILNNIWIEHDQSKAIPLMNKMRERH